MRLSRNVWSVRAATLTETERDHTVEPLSLQQVLIELLFQLLHDVQLSKLRGDYETVKNDRTILCTSASRAASVDKELSLLYQRGQRHDATDAEENDVRDDERILQRQRDFLSLLDAVRAKRETRAGAPPTPFADSRTLSTS